MKGKLEKFALPILAGLCILAFVLYFSPWRLRTGKQAIEIPVNVVEVKQVGEGGVWSVPRDAVSGEPGPSSVPFVLKVKNLRTEQLPVKVTGSANSHVLLQSDELKHGDLLVLQPGTIESGRAVVLTAGVNHEKLLRLTLEAGMAAVVSEDLDESVRFISANYRDNLGFDVNFMKKLLERAYKEFDQPRLELTQPPAVQIQGNKALIRAQLRLTAVYRGSRSYLLGDQASPNDILLVLDKSANGWKLSRIEGLRPLGFEEGSFKLLGARLGLPLTEADRKEEQQFCMPCRQRVAERFGPEQGQR
ncbi:MAG: hypothetical protein JSV60_04470 [Desulfobacterales bacterium]|nr:MAG: hypothetical protein JSV60_04470 [Desulfobacterales bacterium]